MAMRGVPGAAVVLLSGVAACTTLLGDDFEVVSTTGAGAAGAGTGTGVGGGVGGDVGGGAATCGDGERGGTESCDDGNTTADDGCDSSCAVEGSCDAPRALPETSSDAVRTEWGIQSATGGVSQVDLAACDGTPLGAGSDRIFSFTTTDVRDVTVSLTSSFSHVLRLMTAPCDTSTELSEPGETDGCTTGDELIFPALPAGSYFAVVDGSAADDSGSFELTVVASCPRSALRLTELQIGDRDAVAIENGAPSCSADLSGLTVLFDDSSEPDVEVDLSTQLALPGAPEGILAAGEQVWLSDDPAAGEIATGAAVPFEPLRGGVAALCDGSCSGSGAAVIDLVAFSEGADHPTLPTGTTFSPAGLQGIVIADDAEHMSYQRAATTGVAPDFLAADWELGFVPPTCFYDSFEDGNYDGWATVAASGVTYDVINFTASHGSHAADLWGNTGAYQGFSRTIDSCQPTTIRYALRGSTSTGAVGWVMMGDSNLTGTDGIAQVRLSSTRINVTVQGISLMLTAYTPTDWNVISYENIDWTAKTFDLRVNGNDHGNRGFWDQSLDEITQIHLYNTADGFAQFDHFLLSE
jgi:cysteine-rich repeat protein